MKNFYIFFTFSILSFNSFAQFSMDVTSLSTAIDIYDDTLFNIHISNQTNTNQNFWWKVIKPGGFPSNWETQVCDLNQCYNYNFDKCPANRKNQVDPNATILVTMHFNPDSTEGSANLCFKIYSDPECLNEIASTDCNDVITAGTTSSDEMYNNQVLIYPNPTTDVFSIKNDDEVTLVKVYDVMGRLKLEEEHSLGNKHEVGDFEQSIYNVLIYKNDHLIKTIFLIKI